MAWFKGLLEGFKGLGKTVKAAKAKTAQAVVKTPKVTKATEIASTTKKAAKLTEELRTMRTATGRIAGEVPKAIRSVSKSAKTNIGAITGAGIGAGLGLLAGSILMGSARAEEGKEDQHGDGKTEDEGKTKGGTITTTTTMEESGGALDKAENWAEGVLTGMTDWPVLGEMAKGAIENRQALPFLILLVGGVAVGGYAIYKKVAFSTKTRVRSKAVVSA